MPPITIYTTPFCSYCARAKQLLQSKGAAYDEIDAGDEAVRAQMMQRSGGRRSVPQIFIGDIHVGGCDDLYALDRAGKLQGLLDGNPAA